MLQLGLHIIYRTLFGILCYPLATLQSFLKDSPKIIFFQIYIKHNILLWQKLRLKQDFNLWLDVLWFDIFETLVDNTLASFLLLSTTTLVFTSIFTPRPVFFLIISPIYFKAISTLDYINSYHCWFYYLSCYFPNLLNIKHEYPLRIHLWTQKYPLMLLTCECKILLSKKFCLQSSRTWWWKFSILWIEISQCLSIQKLYLSTSTQSI